MKRPTYSSWSTTVCCVGRATVTVGGGGAAPCFGASLQPATARVASAKVASATAKAANQAEDAIKHAAVTAKIKSKMVLDDLVKARNIHVETNGTVVTLTGVVDSEAERKRAVELAKETEGVTSVIDHLRVR